MGFPESGGTTFTAPFVIVYCALLVTLPSTRGSYEYITSALFAEYKLRTRSETLTLCFTYLRTNCWSGASRAACSLGRL